jgi:hypothetical protein
MTWTALNELPGSSRRTWQRKIAAGELPAKLDPTTGQRSGSRSASLKGRKGKRKTRAAPRQDPIRPRVGPGRRPRP